MTKQFHIWAAGDAHVGTDIRRGRASLADALRQSEGNGGSEPFDWDIMLDVGDLSGSQGAPDDHEGQFVHEQYAVLKSHRREQIYNILGNHDASGPGEETQWWFRKYVDPAGQSTATSGIDNARRPFAAEGTWERYKVEVGNIVILMMGDRNDGGPPVGRGERGGYPAGAVTGETFDWWVEQVETNADKIIITAHHHMLKNTTVGSGEWEGFTGKVDPYGKREGHYHGYFRDGGPMGAGYLYWVDGNPDAQAFERYLEAHPGAIDLWLGGHTHTFPGDCKNGRTHMARKWSVTFLNCAAMTKHHINTISRATPMSRPLTLEDGKASMKVRCYLHTSDFAPQGFYQPQERVIPLRHAFKHPG